MATPQIDSNVRTHGNARRDGVDMPAVPGATPFEATELDRVGAAFHDLLLPTILGSVVGGVAGSRTARGAGMAVRGLAALAGAAVVPAMVAGAALLGLAGKGGRGGMTDRAGTTDSPTALGGAADAAAAPGRLRVMSFNIHDGWGATGTWGTRDDLAAIAETIHRERPDVVLLQEVSHLLPLSGMRDQTAWLAHELQADGAVFAVSSQRVTARQKGTALLTFNGHAVEGARGLVLGDLKGDGALRRTAGAVGAVAKQAGVKLDYGGNLGVWHPRAPLDAMVRTPGGELVRVMSLHLSGTGPGAIADRTAGQRRELDALVPTLRAWDGPTIIAGDFNVSSYGRDGALERELLGAAGLVDAFTSVGMPPNDPARASFRDGGKIDRIYASGDLDVTDAYAVREATPSSDHLPIVAEVAL